MFTSSDAVTSDPDMSLLSWAAVEGLADVYGDSFYLLDLAKFATNYHAFLSAFQSVYANSQIAYSYKTNYTPQFCQWVQQNGGYAEVVSGMEYDLALTLKVPAERIIFNGPYKPVTDFERALLNGSIINLDGAYEVTQLQSLAMRYPDKKLKVGIRCNFDVGTPQRSRFGFDVDSPDFSALLQTLRDIPNCQIVGLHCHYLAPERSAANYARIAQQMVTLALTEFAEHPLAFIDLGGGFFSHMSAELQQQFPYPIPDFEAYGYAMASVFAHAFPHNNGPELILEPGLALVADAMQFVAKIIDIKQIDTRHIALVAGSQYDVKPTLSPRNLPIQIISAPTGHSTNNVFDLVGTTCMENDCLFRGYTGSLKANDFVIFNNVGAYTTVLRPPFINPAAAILAIDTTENCTVIRRKETTEDIFKTYILSSLSLT